MAWPKVFKRVMGSVDREEDIQGSRVYGLQSPCLQRLGQNQKTSLVPLYYLLVESVSVDEEYLEKFCGSQQLLLCVAQSTSCPFCSIYLVL